MYNQQPSTIRLLVSCLITLICLVTLAGIGVPVASADAPGDPVTFHGHATDGSGDPLEQGTEIVAVSESGGEGSATIDDSGWYDDLIVSASSGDDIHFYQESTDGTQAIESFNVDDHSIYKQNLTFAEIDELKIELESHEVLVDTYIELTVLAVFEDGSEIDITEKADSESSNPDIAKVHTDRIAAYEPGEVTISATYTDSSGNDHDAVADIHVEDKLKDLQVDLQTESPTKGDSTGVTVIAEYRSDLTQAVTEQTNITSYDEDVIVVGDSSLIAQSAGSAEIEFSYTDTGLRISDTVDITVEERTPVDLDVAVNNVELEPDQTTELSATAFFDEAQDADVSTHESTSIESNDSSVVSVDETTVIAHGGGTATLNVTYSEGGETLTESTTVAVETVPTDLYFSALPKILTPDTTDEIELTAAYSDGVTHEVAAAGQTEYAITNDSVVTISDGILTAENPGTTTVTVTYTDQNTTLNESTEIEVLETTSDIQPLTYANFSPAPQDIITEAEQATFAHDSISNESTAEFSSSMLPVSVTTSGDVTEQSLYAGDLSTVPDRVADPEGTVLATTELVSTDGHIEMADVQFPDLLDQYTSAESDTLQLTHHDGTKETTHNITADTGTLTTSDAETTVTTDLASPSVFVLAEPATTDEDGDSHVPEDDGSSDDGSTSPDSDTPDRNGDDDSLGPVMLLTIVVGGTLGAIAIGLLYMYRDDDDELQDETTTTEPDPDSTVHNDVDTDGDAVTDSTDTDVNSNSETTSDSDSGSLFDG